jgi:hypothetical protein
MKTANRCMLLIVLLDSVSDSDLWDHTSKDLTTPSLD